MIVLIRSVHVYGRVFLLFLYSRPAMLTARPAANLAVVGF